MIWPDWSEETVVVVATGPSAKDVPLELAKGKARFLAVKDGWTLCPWSEVLYACDHHWWDAHNGVIPFEGLRLAYDPRTVEKWRGLKIEKVNISRAHEDMLFDKIGTIAWGGNSGYHAINLAAQFGAKRILLVGFDMRIDQGKHFFGDHSYTKERPSQANMKAWVPILDRQAEKLAARGIEVLNCSMVSALKAYRKIEFKDAIV